MEWISVKDRLPKERGCYLALWTNYKNNETFVAQAYYADKIQFAPHRKDAPVTHWMPLPQLPKMNGKTFVEWGGDVRCITSDGRNVNMADELNRLEREKDGLD